MTILKYILLLLSFLAGIINLLQGIDEENDKTSYFVAAIHFIIVIIILTNL